MFNYRLQELFYQGLSEDDILKEETRIRRKARTDEGAQRLEELKLRRCVFSDITKGYKDCWYDEESGKIGFIAGLYSKMFSPEQIKTVYFQEKDVAVNLGYNVDLLEVPEAGEKGDGLSYGALTYDEIDRAMMDLDKQIREAGYKTWKATPEEIKRQYTELEARAVALGDARASMIKDHLLDMVTGNLLSRYEGWFTKKQLEIIKDQETEIVKTKMAKRHV